MYTYVNALEVQRLLVEWLFPKTSVLGRVDFINKCRNNVILILFDFHYMYTKTLYVYIWPHFHTYELNRERDREPWIPAMLGLDFFVLIQVASTPRSWSHERGWLSGASPRWATHSKGGCFWFVLGDILLNRFGVFAVGIPGSIGSNCAYKHEDF